MAFKVTYDGNGSTSGQVPVDNNNYNNGDTVQVLPPNWPWSGVTSIPANATAGSLVRAGGSFAYWNTKRDGGGTGYYWPAGGASLQISADVTLYAQWYVPDGLTGGGRTTHFVLMYDRALAAGTSPPEPARTNALLAACESDYAWMSARFGDKYKLDDIVTVPIATYVANLGGGANASAIVVLKPDRTGTAESVRCLLVEEVVEYFMHAQDMGWGFVDGVGNEESSGEGLSLFLVQQFALARGFANPYSYAATTATTWLNSALPSSDPNSTRFYDGAAGFDYGARGDYVNTLRPYPGNGPGTGCSVLFIYYLMHQLGFTVEQIIAAAPGFTGGMLNSTATLRGVYQNLTGDAGDPFPFFKRLFDATYPPDQPASFPGPNPDDPFPLAMMDFWVDKGTFGKDEVKDVVQLGGGVWPKAFWVIVEGFSRNSFNALGGAITLTGPFSRIPGVTISQNPDVDYENAANPQAPQRIRIPFDITFTAASLTRFPASGGATYELDAALAMQGAPVRGGTASVRLELVAGEDPYFTNIDPSQNNVYYLSQDLRVFSAVPGTNATPVTGGPAFPNAGDPSPADAYVYIQQLLSWLNATYSDPAAFDPFDTVLPGQMGALLGDSSVTPGAFNFAVARVRLRGAAVTAPNVRVFFRLWSTETADADYRIDSTYPSSLDAAGLPQAPQVGKDHQTLPFCASGDFMGNTDYVAGGANTRDIQIPVGRDNVWAYFGCFLNLYDPGNTIDGQPVQAWLNGTHHCLVAQIAYDDAPIIAGATPASSDKLAQRNLQVTLSDNPGGPETHRIPQTFDIRPSATLSETANPDELMIDWGTVPKGSVASIYWPQVTAADVIALASKRYSSHTLLAADANTITCKITGGVSYVPIPAGTGENFAGLFTIDLPTTVVTGQEFDVVVRRIATRALPPPVIGLELAAANVPVPGVVTIAALRPRRWRYVTGAFQVKIPVRTAASMLGAEEDTLAIMKWRLQHMSTSSRWYPVLQRYLTYLVTRVAGLGGDPDSIPPSLSGAPVARPQPISCHTGKVGEVLFDCFGDFDGFVLESCDGGRAFHSCDRGIGDLVLRACRERMTLTVYADAGPKSRIRQVVVRCC